MVKVPLNTNKGYPIDERTVNKYVLIGSLVVALFFVGVIIYLSTRHQADFAGTQPGEKLVNIYQKTSILSSFKIIAPERAVDGLTISVTIIAMDRHGRPLTNYIGTVNITSEHILLPERSRYMIGDTGRHTYRARVISPGTAYIEVEDLKKKIKAKSGPIIIEVNPRK